MSYKINRISLSKGIHFSSITDPKFKHNRISVCLVMPLEHDKASSNAIVPYVLRQGYKDCPSFTELNKKLCELYGASIDASVDKFGKYQLLSLAVSGIDNRFALGGEDIIGKCTELLCNVLLNPNMENGEFLGNEVELEKQYLIDTIQAEINDKRSYAKSRCKGIMCEGEAIAIKRFGYEEDVKAITNKTAAEAYDYIMQNAQIEFMFVGSGDPTFAMKTLKSNFADSNRTNVVEVEPVPYRPNVSKAKNIVETMDIVQAKMVLGFRVDEPKDERELAALRLMSALLGGTPVSLLFKNVREKLSLCYYCVSGFDRNTGIMMIDSGIEDANKDKAYNEIFVQIDALKKGSFTEDDLLHTKLILGTSLKATTDSLPSVESWYLTQILRGTNVTPLEELTLLESITKQDIVKMAQSIVLDTAYLLTSKA